MMQRFSVVIIAVCMVFSQAVQADPAKAAATAKERTGGKVLDVKPGKQGSYRVKVIDAKGKVRYVTVPK